MKHLLTLLIALTFITSYAHAKNIDCEKASTNIEKAICSNPEIRHLNDEVETLHEAIRDISPNPQTIKADQTKWINNVRNQCGTKSNCLINAYKQRIKTLEKSWEKHNRILNASHFPPANKPFEGYWETCFYYQGSVICSSAVVLQQNTRLCGTYDYWATGKVYQREFEADIQNSHQALEKSVCGRPGGGVDTECAEHATPPSSQVQSQPSHKQWRVCGNTLYSNDNNSTNSDDHTSKSCKEINKKTWGGYYYRRPLSDAERQDLMKKPLINQCMNGKEPQK